MSLELDLSISTHKEEGNPTGTSTRTTLAPKDPEVCNEPPQGAEEPMTENIIEGLEVHKEPLRFIIPWLGKCTLTERKTA